MKKGLGRIAINWNKPKGVDQASKAVLVPKGSHTDNYRTLWIVVNEADKPSSKVFDKIIKGVCQKA